VEQGFSIDTRPPGGSGGDALDLASEAGITLIQEANGGAIIGAGNGIYAINQISGGVSITTTGDVEGPDRGINVYNFGSGGVSITTTGDITGNALAGISSFNGATSTADLTIDAVDVEGGTEGILSDNQGTGGLSITTTGTVTASDGTGIVAENANTATGDLAIDVLNVAGSDDGIYAQNSGSGDLEITARGTVEGTNRGLNINNFGSGAVSITAIGDVTASGVVAGDNEGIFAFGGDNTDGMTIHAAQVTGSERGINADHNGGGALKITATGPVTGGFRGLVSYSGPASTSQTIRTYESVTGNQDGIRAVHQGSGALSITTEDVTGLDESGILAENGGTGATNIEINGAVRGDFAGVAATGGDSINITVNAGSSVTSTGAGVFTYAIITEGPTTLKLGGTLNGGASGAALLYDLDDRLELRTTATVNGKVLAELGEDTLAFGGTGDGDFDLGNIDMGGGTQQFQGFEVFQVESGDWSFSGGTTEAFSVTGGSLGGNGTFGGLTFTGGTLAPGNSFGTVTVNGAFAMAASSTLEIEVDAAGRNDKVIVNGTVNLTGATLSVLAANGNYKPRTDYTIIENDGNDVVTGVFATVTSNLAFLVPFVFYDGGDGNDVVLSLRRGDTLLQDVARTPNQRAVAGALSKFSFDNPLFLAVLGQTAAGARQAFDALSGEIHATVAGTLADDSRYVREAVLGRLMQAGHTGQALSAGGPQVTSSQVTSSQVASLDSQAMALGYDGKSLAEPAREPLAFWTRAYGAWGDFDSDGNAASADRDLGGFISGMDADIGSGWRAGLATGASFSNVDVNARYSSADVSTYQLGGYIGGMAGALALRGGGMWAWSEIDTSRAVVFPGFFERQKANYDADTGQLFGEIAYPTQVGGIALEPFGGLAFVSVNTDSFTERGGLEASLRGVNLDQDVGYTSVGLRMASTMMWGATQVTPHISAAWLHAFDDVTPGASLAFATTGIGFAIDGVPLAEDSALLDAGLDFAVSDRVSAGVSYTGQFGDGVTDNGVKGRFTWLF